MVRSITTRAYVTAWLLCVVLACLVVHSPHCDLCDGPYFVTSSSVQHPVANHQVPATPEKCNGICWVLRLSRTSECKSSSSFDKRSDQ